MHRGMFRPCLHRQLSFPFSSLAVVVVSARLGASSNAKASDDAGANAAYLAASIDSLKDRMRELHADGSNAGYSAAYQVPVALATV
jgi:hypothetical protein